MLKVMPVTKLYLIASMMLFTLSGSVLRDNVIRSITPDVYIYASETAGDSFLLNYLDVASLEVSRTVEISKPRSTDSLEAIISPDGKWIAIIPTGLFPVSETLILYNVLDGETRTLEGNVSSELLYSYSDRLFGPSPNVVWSPNGQLLAFISEGTNGSGVNVYDVTVGRITSIANALRPFGNLAWSDDSSKLGVTTQQCLDSCQLYIEVYDVGNAQLVSSTAVLGEHYGALVENICNLQWSPDGTHMNFMSVCDPTRFQITKEVYLLDTQSGVVFNATNLTEVALPMADPPRDNVVGRFAQYTTFWYSENALLIGAVYSRNASSNRVAETFMYDPLQQTITSIASVRAVEFASSATSGFLAISTSDHNEHLVDVRIVPLSNLQSLQTQAIYPPGCNLDWHASDNLLAYTKSDDGAGGCRGDIEGLVFVNPDQGIVSEFPISNTDNIVPIGWAVVPPNDEETFHQTSLSRPNPAATRVLPLSDQETLWGFLSSPDCERACVLGIQPSVTTFDEAMAILSDLGIDFSVKTIGYESEFRSYRDGMAIIAVDVGSSSYDFPGEIVDKVVILGGFNRAEEIILSLENVSVSDVLDWHGAPSWIGYIGSYVLAYPAEGVAYLISNENPRQVINAHIRSPRAIWGGLGPIQSPCVGPSSVCDIATATTTHATTPTPTAMP